VPKQKAAQVHYQVPCRLYGIHRSPNLTDVPLIHYFAEFIKFSDDSQHVVGHAMQSTFERKSEKKAKKLGRLRKSSYLCSVRMYVLTIR
jgi:hypothetical protein